MDGKNHSSAMKDTISADYERARNCFRQRNYTKALEIAEDSLSVHGRSKNSALLFWLQGAIFFELATKTENFYVKYVYLTAAELSGDQADDLLGNSIEFIHFHVNLVFSLAELTKSKEKYEGVVREAERAIALENPEDMSEYKIDLQLGSLGNLSHEERIKNLRQNLERLINLAKVRLGLKDASNNVVTESSVILKKVSDSGLTRALQGRVEMNKNKTQKATVERLRSFWKSMSAKSKMDFMKVSIQKLEVYIEQLYGSEGTEALGKVLDIARTKRQWRLWRCGTCREEFHCPTECMKHLEQKHFQKFGPPLEDIIPRKVDEAWDQMIYAGDWEPVNIVEAVAMMKTQPEEVKKFVYVNGWSKDWPLDNHGRRRKCLKEIRDILKSLVERNFLYNGAGNWVLFRLSGCQLLPLTEQYLDDFGLLKTPQIICFVELCHLNTLRSFLCQLDKDKNTDRVIKAVDLFSCNYQIKESLLFSNDFSCVLLDKRLFEGKIGGVDDVGIIEVAAADDLYAQVLPQGDEIISWLYEGNEIGFQKPMKIYNLDFLLAVLRILEDEHSYSKSLYKAYVNVKDYVRALLVAEKLCIEEDERRTKYPDGEWQTYASVLCKRCNELVTKDGVNLLDATKLQLTVVRDVLEGARNVNLGKYRCEDYPNWLSKHCDVEDGFVIKSIQSLKRVKSRETLIATNIMTSDNSKTQHLKCLVRLSVYDYRSIILPLLKLFLRMILEEMLMDAKARSDFMGALLLLETQEEKEKQSKLPNKKKKDRKHHKKSRSNKEASTGSSATLYPQAEESESSFANESIPSNILEGVDESIKIEEEKCVEDGEKTLLDEAEALLLLGMQQDADTFEFPKRKKRNRKDRWPRANKEASTRLSFPRDQETRELESPVADRSRRLNSSGCATELRKKKEEYTKTTVKARDMEKQMNCMRGIRNESEKINARIEYKMDIKEDASDQDENVRMKCEKLSPNDGCRNSIATAQIEAAPPSSLSEDSGTGDLKDDFQPKMTDSSALLASASSEDATGNDSALDMIMKALWHIKVFRDELEHCLAPTHVHVEDPCAICALRDLFQAFRSEQTDPREGLYPYLLNSLQDALKVTHPQAKRSIELLVAVFEFLHSWKTRYNESIVDSIFRLEEFERMVCYNCRQKPNYPEQWSHGIMVSANSIRQIKFVLEGVKFEKVLKLILMNHLMICDPKTGGCGERNYVCHSPTRCPRIFTVALEWGNNETTEEIYATVTALATEIDISMLYDVEKSRAIYILVLMIGRAGTEHYCVSNEKENGGKWMRHYASTEEDIGDWESLVGFCKEKKVRPEILFFQSKVEGSRRRAAKFPSKSR